MENGVLIVGTPEDAIEVSQRIHEISGGFGALLAIHMEWASRERTRYSYELWARHVAPQFQGTLRGPKGSAEMVAAKAIDGSNCRLAAKLKAVEEIGGLLTDEERRRAEAARAALNGATS
ncbi:MAG: hypothetical protein U0556_05070 [Dehalococcoidia bacterium]